jgi:hypothetical protein
MSVVRQLAQAVLVLALLCCVARLVATAISNHRAQDQAVTVEDRPTWVRDQRGGGVLPGGDVGGDVQVSESFSVRFHHRDRPEVMVTYCYYATVEPDVPAKIVVERQTEYLVCTDPNDPGGSEIWSAYRWTALPGGFANVQAAADAANHAAQRHLVCKEFVGRFLYGTLHRNRPHTLTTWRVTTTSGRTANRIAHLFGGSVQHDPATGLPEVLTTSATVDILLDSPAALSVDWQRTAEATCVGDTQDHGRPCTCPAILAQRRVAAKQGRGCQPRVEVRLRLRDDPALGMFSFLSEDWSFVELVAAARVALRRMDRPVTARLGINRTLHTLRSGRVLPYTMPVLTLLDRPH